jgi:hypothetical protein
MFSNQRCSEFVAERQEGTLPFSLPFKEHVFKPGFYYEQTALQID